MTSYLTIKEFADSVGVSRDTIERAIREKKIKAVKKNPYGGKTSPLLIPAGEFITWKKLQNGQTKR